jgi:VanZ family protein
LNSSLTLRGERTGRRSWSQARALIRAWLPAAIGILIICLESSDFFSAAHTGEFLQYLWNAVVHGASQVDIAQDNHLLRKTGHFIGYGTLALLFYRGWRRSSHILSYRRPRIVDVVYSFACALVVACCDEYHQTLLPSRTGRPQDVFLDIAGSAFFLLLLQLWLIVRTRRRPAPAFAGDLTSRV